MYILSPRRLTGQTYDRQLAVCRIQFASIPMRLSAFVFCRGDLPIAFASTKIPKREWASLPFCISSLMPVWRKTTNNNKKTSYMLHSHRKHLCICIPYSKMSHPPTIKLSYTVSVAQCMLDFTINNTANTIYK